MKLGPRRSADTAITGIFTLLLLGSVVAVLSIAREICIPVALAVLLTFLLSPLVTRLERWIGRMAAVLVVIIVVSGGVGVVGYVVGQQFMDLTAKVPDYKANIQAKMRVLRMPNGGAFERFTQTVEELRQDLPAPDAAAVGKSGTSTRTVPVRVVEESGGMSGTFQTLLGPIFSGLAMGGLVLLLTVFMLLNREDLRGRLIRLVGHGHIGATSHAMADAGQRVSRYLVMQLIVNVTYGIPVAIGLYLIGVPNALLWGALAAVLRFIPYVGPWIAAAAPIGLALAVSDGWAMPLATIGLFVVLEIISNNVMEPWLYGTSTGVSALALILAAIFWAWLWGPIGLVLATPLTVCLVVIGRHVPRLAFFSVMLSDEQALEPHQECYHRLLRADLTEATALVDGYLKHNPLTALYDNVLIPVVAAAEIDHGLDALDVDQRAVLHQGVRDLLDDLAERPLDAMGPVVASGSVLDATALPPPACRVLCLPVRALRDELTAAMAAHVLSRQSFSAEVVASKLTTAEMVDLTAQRAPDAVCISVVAPSAIVHARHLCARLHERLPHLTIVVGLWGAPDQIAAATTPLTGAGASSVVSSVAEAVVALGSVSTRIATEHLPASIPADEEVRLAALAELALLESGPEPTFDRIVTKLSRVFDMPMAMMTLIDTDRQVIKASVGVPASMAAEGPTPRAQSLCGHVVARNDLLVIEDLARDVRFARNPWLTERGVRFYAGVPVRAANGQPIGALCLLDAKPRVLGERDRRLLAVIADEMSEQLKTRVLVGPGVPDEGEVVGSAGGSRRE